MNEFSIYVHIPFCISKCKYCDFYSFDDKDSLIEAYANSVIKEINNSKCFLSKNDICKTIYIGGGTPSYIESKYIVEIIKSIKKKYNVYNNAEITIELNPCSITTEKLNDYYNIGINRISVGLQTTNNDLLKLVGRKHTYEMFLEKYNLIKSVGFNNINVDLMIGLPNQTVKDVDDSLRKLVRLKPTHISCYSLIIYENTPIFNEIKKNKYVLPNDETERDMYYNMQSLLKQNGYEQYEISNFSKNDYESKHNMMCWRQYRYIGFGAGAHSFVKDIRYSNISDIQKYIRNITDSKYEANINIEETLEKIDLMKEYMILGFRLLSGINVKEFEEKFNENVENIFKIELEKIKDEGYIEYINDNIVLTKKGLDFDNLVCREFV